MIDVWFVEEFQEQQKGLIERVDKLAIEHGEHKQAIQSQDDTLAKLEQKLASNIPLTHRYERK